MKLCNENELSQLRMEYEEDDLFCSLYPGLAELNRFYNELSPTEIWRETLNELEHLKKFRRIDLEVIERYNKLIERYSVFVTPSGEQIERNEIAAQYTAVCVLTCVNFCIVARPDELDTQITKDAYEKIIDLIGRHPVHAHLYLAHRKEEERLEKRNQLIKRTDRLADTPKSKGPRKEVQEDDLRMKFNGIFNSRITLDEWVAFVNYCEGNMTFSSKIDRLAYLVFASHKSWLKGCRTLQLDTFLGIQDAVVGKQYAIQQSEASRKFNEMKDEKFYDSLIDMNNTFTFNSQNIAAGYYKKLRENVKRMHTLYADMKNETNNN